MAMRVFHRRCSFGTKCAHCGDELIAPVRTEYRDERDIRHVWHCPNCCACFEAIAPSLSEIPSIKVTTTRDIPPAWMIA